MTLIKICGITSLEDALMAIAAGADALGLNFVPTSKRVIDRATATYISDTVGDLAEMIAVVADRPALELEELREATGIRWLQLHGSETVSDLDLVLPEAFKAVAIGSAVDALSADAYGGTRLLVDTKSPDELGGTGQSFDWSLAVPLARRRDVIVAGGLDPGNVTEVLRVLRPFGVDVASGVEVAGNPRRKDAAKVRAFIDAVRAWDQQQP